MKKSKVKYDLHVWPGSPALCLSRPCLGQLRALLRRVQRRSCWTPGLFFSCSIRLHLTLFFTLLSPPSTSHISSQARLTSPESIAEQTGILISQVCPQAADAAACEAVSLIIFFIKDFFANQSVSAFALIF